MIGLPSSTRIYLCTQPVDFRKGFDGLAGIVTGRSSATRSPVTD
jgi:transposase